MCRPRGRARAVTCAHLDGVDEQQRLHERDGERPDDSGALFSRVGRARLQLLLLLVIILVQCVQQDDEPPHADEQQRQIERPREHLPRVDAKQLAARVQPRAAHVVRNPPDVADRPRARRDV